MSPFADQYFFPEPEVLNDQVVPSKPWATGRSMVLIRGQLRKDAGQWF
jgi:hypothetical protein